MAKSPSIIELNNRMIALEKELKELKADMAKGLKLATHKPREIPYFICCIPRYWRWLVSLELF